MKNENTNKFRKTSGILSIAFFIATLLLEIIRQILPPHTIMPTTTDGIITVFRSIFFVIFALSFTVFLFLVLRNRCGKVKAVFFTLYSDCLLGFFIGLLITMLASSQNSASFGITPLESIYYYFLGIFVMLISVSLTLIGMIAYVILQAITTRKIKKHEQSS